MTRPLVELVEQFCQYQLKQRGRTKGGVQTARWSLEQFLLFVRDRWGKIARLLDLNRATIQEWMDDMAARDLSVSSMRTRQSTLSSFCTWLVKREVLPANSVVGMDRPPYRIEPPKQVPTPSLMDALIEAARKRQRPRDVHLPHYAVYGDAARFRGDTPGRHLDGALGLTTRSRERRTDQRHSLAGVGYALSACVRRAGRRA